jgi:hypothetical protein
MPQGESFIIYFETKNLDEEVSRLQGLGIPFLHEPIDQN